MVKRKSLNNYNWYCFRKCENFGDFCIGMLFYQKGIQQIYFEERVLNVFHCPEAVKNIIQTLSPPSDVDGGKKIVK